jgi:Zinc knuckle
MDVDRTRARGTPRRGCFRCGDPNHFARDCTTPVDIRSADVLDEVIRQLDGDMLEELVARLATTEAATDAPEDFLPRAE